MSTFEIGLRCENCWHRWAIDVPFRAEVKDGIDGVWVHPHDCYGRARCKGFHPECPVCGRHDKTSRTAVEAR